MWLFRLEKISDENESNEFEVNEELPLYSKPLRTEAFLTRITRERCEFSQKGQRAI